MIITFDSSTKGPVLVVLNKWLMEMNLYPLSIMKVEVDSDLKRATVFHKHGGYADFELKQLPEFVQYMTDGLGACGHAAEDSYGVIRCISCRAKTPVYNGERGLFE